MIYTFHFCIIIGKVFISDPAGLFNMANGLKLTIISDSRFSVAVANTEKTQVDYNKGLICDSTENVIRSNTSILITYF